MDTLENGEKGCQGSQGDNLPCFECFRSRPMKTIVVVVLLAAAVVWSVHFSQELLALNGEIMARFGTILIALSVTIERWAVQ